jgi:uncharacterized protein
MSKAEQLYRLQLLDVDLDKARKQSREIEKALASNPAVTHAQTELDAAREVHHKAALEVRMLELEARSQDDKLKSDEDRLYTGNIHNPKELIDLQHEVDLLKRNRSTLEEKLLNAMLVVEEAVEVERRCLAALDEARRHWSEDSVASREELAQLKDRIIANEERRTAICLAIPRTELEQYTNLRSKKAGGIAVAPVKGGACGLCGESPSSVLLQQARTGSSLALCNGCGRILFPG